MMFAGRNQLDAATLDRFRAGIMEVDYDEKVEKALVDEEVLKWALPIRRSIRSHRLHRVMSTRLMLDLTKMKQSAKWGVAQWSKAYFSDWTNEEFVK